MHRLLLRNGIVLDTEPDVSVRPGVDVLIEDGRIAQIAPDLPADGAEVIDATDRIVLPGFVDTHRHCWQTVLRGTAVDVDLGAYLGLVLGGYAPRFRPEDVEVSTLVGALECLDSGITTVQDHSHIQYSPEHTEAGISALRTAGIRAVFGYGYPVFDAAARRLAEVRRVRTERLAADDELVTMALAPAGPSYAPIEVVEEDWRLADELGLRIAVHVGSGPVAERPIAALRDRGLLAAGTLYVHGNSLPDDELALIAESGGAVAIAPAVEAQMGHGAPMTGRLRAASVLTGLGADVVTTVPGDMFSLMRAALLSGQLGDGPRATAADVLRMATLDGAAALGMSDRIGSLRVGKQADVVLLRTDTVSMAGAEHNPVAAVVAAAHPGDVDTVLVAGRPVKRDGLLVHPGLDRTLAAARGAARHLQAR